MRRFESDRDLAFRDGLGESAGESKPSGGGIGESGDVISDSMDGKVKSWVSAAKDKKNLKKYEVEISMKDGKHTVAIPKEVLVDSTPSWDDFVVGKFLDLAPHMAKVHMVVNKIWSYGELASEVEVYVVNTTMMRFRISNPKAREKVLKRGMWNIVGVPMVVTKWTPAVFLFLVFRIKAVAVIESAYKLALTSKPAHNRIYY